MSSINFTERKKIEKLLSMSGGYVADFSDKTFGYFFLDTVGIDIHSDKYTSTGTSKATKLREFWKLESDYLAGKSIRELIKYMEEYLLLHDDPEKRNLLEPCKTIADRLVSGNISLDQLKETTVVFNAKHLSEQIRRIEKSIQSDPTLAIGTAKELIETCCKTILAERGKPVKGTPDIPTLTKETLKELKLVPEGISNTTRGSDIIKRILQNLGTIGNGLAELRGLYGTGHGKHGRTEGLKARHAKLAVGAASTLVTFLFDTHKETMP